MSLLWRCHMDRNISILKKVLTWGVLLLTAAACVFLFKAYREGHFKSVETLQCYIASFGLFAPAILTLIQALQVVLPILPGFLGCIVGALLFGAWGGFWCNYIGISAGSIIAYFLARKFGIALVEQLIPMEKYDRFVAWVNKHNSYTLLFFLCILLPLAPDDFLCYFSGLTKMPPKRFIWIIILAKPWCILVYSLMPQYFIP